MKMKIVAILIVVVLILTWFNGTKKDVPEGTVIIAEETAEELGTIKVIKKSDDNCDSRMSCGIKEQETIGSRNLLQEEESVIQMTEPDSLTTKTSTSRVYENTLCVGLAKEIYDATNDERIAAGLNPLIWDDELAKCADIRAEEVITNFSHVRPDGTKCYVLSDLIWGENIAKSPPHANGYVFVAHWMASNGHKANILQSQYTTIGVGTRCIEQGDTAVQLFGVDNIPQ